jgi:hypothetical protein
MLLPDNIHPEQTIYYNASHVLTVLLQKRHINLVDLYVETILLVKMSVPIFFLSLDWLFLINVIEYNENEGVILCI